MTDISTSTMVYLAAMLGVVVVLTAVLIPALFFKKCSGCGTRNGLDAQACKRCEKAFPTD